MRSRLSFTGFRAAIACLLAVSLAACSSTTPAPTPPLPSVYPHFDPTLADRGVEGETWLGFPFPADHRRVPNGNIRMSDFPNVEDVTLLDEYLTEAESTLDGFSLQGVGYFSFSGDIDTSSLPPTADEFRSDESPVWLVDVTAGSPSYGQRVPLRWQYYDGALLADAIYIAKHTLGIGPAWGSPLRESTTYALIIRDTIRALDGTAIGRPALVASLLATTATAPPTTAPPVSQSLFDELRTDWAPLRAYAAGASLDTSSILVATVFTTQSITAPLDAITDQIANDLPAPTQVAAFLPQASQGGLPYRTSSFQWNSTDTVNLATYEATYVAPNYQEGSVPYSETGGALHFVGGSPVKVFDETINFVLTVPSTPPDPVRGCYPIVIYGHGTGGSRYSFRSDGTAGRLAARGIAGISIDMPMHGVRSQGQLFDIELASFNFYNPASFRAGLRQGAIDTASLLRFVRESLSVSAGDSHTGAAITFCTDTVGYMGHSQGGITGALTIPFAPEIETWMLSGAGAGMGVTILHRDDIVDFSAVLQASFNVPNEEMWSEQHPVVTLIQALADVSDPGSYARYWNHDTTHRAPANVMLTSGEHDEATPYLTGIALALAGYLPVTVPVVIPIPGYVSLGLSPASVPLMGNGASSTTLGFLQFTNDLPNANYDTHFLVFHRPEAIDSSMHFLATGTSGAPAVIRRDANSDAK